MTQHNIYVPPNKRFLSTKYSFGIALVRFNNGRPEVLLACKRTSYAFTKLVRGQYITTCNKSLDNMLVNLFNNTTFDEKLDFMSCNYDQIYYRLNLNSTKCGNFYIAKSRFESTFLLDGGTKLRQLISKSKNINRIWEIPKGRKKTKFEPDINCAVREFTEETCIPKRKYHLFPGAKRIYTYISDGVRYVNTYYIAYTKFDIDVSVDMNNAEQYMEVADLRWTSMNDIKKIDNERKLERLVKPIFNYVKRRVLN